MRTVFVLSIVVLLAGSVAWAAPTEGAHGSADGLIPLPMSIQPASGNWVSAAPLSIAYDAPELTRTSEMLAAALEDRYGVKASTASAAGAATGGILLSLRDADASLGEEGYALDVTAKGVTIRAPKAAGVFYGTQTLLQLLPVPRKGVVVDSFAVPCVSIKDKPRFGWRGLMLDCSRTFLSMDYLHRYVDRLAFYKLNILHLHLTDDQGWRMEIKKHPKLTSVGGAFDPRLKGEVSGFYTQDELRALVRYAADRNVTIVPEIEMPSHCLAALTAYPELSCRGEAYTIVPFMYASGSVPGVPTPPYGVFCAGNDRVYEVMQDVLNEVMDVFPCKYVHIGGDECPKEFWKTCAKCQAQMKAEGLANENELQSYFVKRIEKIVNAKGRTLLGWDEILEGGLAPNATVMAWRGVKGGIEAAQAGHDVVMSPTTHCYFDYDYMATSLKKTYEYEPVPDALTPEQARHVLGAQGNMWTHLARTEPSIDAQIFPRLVALSEVTWSPKESRNWSGFETRMNAHHAWLDAFGAGYYVERPTPGLAVAPDGAPWAIVNNHVYTYVSGVWKSQAGEVSQIAFAPDGRRYALSGATTSAGHALLEWVGGAWKSVDGAPAGISLSVAPDGAVWLVTDKNTIRTRAGAEWKDVPGRVTRIAHGPKGALYALGADTLAGGYPILEWTGTTWNSLGADAAAVELAVGPNGVLWAVNSLSVSWFWKERAWTALPGQVSALAAAPNGALYGIALDPGNQAWTLIKQQTPASGTGGQTWSPITGSALPRD